MPYIHFTEQEKQQANQVDIAAYLAAHGETVRKCGSEQSWESHGGKVSIRGSSWYSQYERVGGGAVSFLQKFYGLSYPEAVRTLLGQSAGNEIIQKPDQAPPAVSKEKKPPQELSIPPKNSDMRRLFAYLIGDRCIDRDVLHAFTHAGLIYEDAEFHNAIFVGTDENGKPMHIQKRSTTPSSDFKGNALGSHPDYSFHYVGQSDKLFVFEAPIDLLAYISMHKDGWEQHSYVALCSTADCAALWMLKTYPQLKNVYLCLDHDSAGIEGAYRIAENIHIQGEYSVWRKMPKFKDWNEDLKALHGKTPIPASEHIRLEHFKSLCKKVYDPEIDYDEYYDDLRPYRGYLLEQTFATINRLLSRIEQTEDKQQIRSHLFEIAKTALGYCYSRDLQMNTPRGLDGYLDCILSDYKPHRDHSAPKEAFAELKSYCSSLEQEMKRKDVLTKRESTDQNIWMCRVVSLAFQMSGAIEWEQIQVQKQLKKQEQSQSQRQLKPAVPAEPTMNFA